MATITYSHETVDDELVVNATTHRHPNDADVAALRDGVSFGCAA